MYNQLRAFFIVCLSLLCTPLAVAQVHDMEMATPRPAGWMVGDLIPIRFTVTVEDSHPLQLASLPEKGPVNYWLEIRDVQLQEREQDGKIEYRLDLEYQNFYVPLDVQDRRIPSFDLIFGEGERAFTISTEPWAFTVSPLRGISLRESDEGHGIVRPLADAEQLPLSTKPTLNRIYVFLAVWVLLAVLLLYHYSIWPWHKRPYRPFGAALKAVRRSYKNRRDATVWMNAMLATHRAFDQTAQRSVLSEDLSNFLQEHKKYSKLEEEIKAFFEASRAAFFGMDEDFAMELMPWSRLIRLCRSLASLERRAS